MPPVDVVTVSNFTGSIAPRFEARTLLFLAAWLENAGEARQYPLHLACIGEPPKSVRGLGEQAGARITMHTPVQADPVGYSNKLRGLEVQHDTAHILLLDTDIMTLADPSAIGELGPCLSILPEIWPRVPFVYWQKIYAEMGLDLPTERIPSLNGELGRLPMRKPLYPEQNQEITSMVPYFNSGVIYAPWQCDLRALWEKGIRHIVATIEPKGAAGKLVIGDDQGGLSIAVELLKRQGLPFRRLPDVYNTVSMHIYRRAVKLDDAKFFHAFRIFDRVTSHHDMGWWMFRFRVRLFRRILQEWSREAILTRNPSTLTRYFLPAMRDKYRLGLRLTRLYHKHVIPALQHA
jgi:hypothetical protein